ncbi:MAG: glyoxylate/hydroxypyruvate reductase A [Betaproteobacteria bacterium]|nr:glyoxylate/hydroxypyruvate reductase A [Betaproteobacteria bacterium]
MNLLFASSSENPDRWIPPLERALPRDRVHREPGPHIDVALVAQPPTGTYARLPNLKLVQSLWMGVEDIVADPDYPRHVPLARLIDPGMIAAMTETVLAHVLDWHRHHYRYRAQQAERRWEQLPQFMAGDRTVGVLGLGALGADAAQALRAHGFRVLGWSRRPKLLPGVESTVELWDVLGRSDILVCLLPLTAETRGILDAKAFARMPQGGCVINVARGGHVIEKDLLAALDSGRISRAYLDVFETEPLPPGHPFWSHPNIAITPHTAALTEPRTSVPKIAANIERVRRGERPEGLIDLAAGY